MYWNIYIEILDFSFRKSIIENMIYFWIFLYVKEVYQEENQVKDNNFIIMFENYFN